jgi:hypothetical protein
MKTAGIVCDNYKIDKFKKELNKQGFKDFEIVPFVGESSTIRVKYKPEQLQKLHALCSIVENHFKNSN